MGSIKVLVDMDGVVSDFVRGICQAHAREWPYSDPKHVGPQGWGLESIFGMSAAEFWSKCDYDFWLGLDLMPEAEEIVDTVVSYVGRENMCFLSSPSNDPGCIPGKKAWLKKHFPDYAKQCLFGKPKEFCAHPGSLLIDDYWENVKKFSSAGGKTLLVGRPWNPLHYRESEILNDLASTLNFLTGT